MKMRRCEDEKMRRCFTDPRYWKNPALRHSREKHTMLGKIFEIVMACRRGAKHISKSKCAKHTMLGALLEVEMSKKCRPLWREAHFQVNMFKTPHAGTTFEGSDVVLRGRRKGFCALPKVSETRGFCSMSKRLSVISTSKFQLD